MDSEEIELLKEAEKVYGIVFEKMPKEKPKVADPPKPKTANPPRPLPSPMAANPPKPKVVDPPKPIIPKAQKKPSLVTSSIPGYKEVEECLMRDKEGKHEEAMKLYEKAGELGNKAAFLNMGNCYMFGKGVKQDKKKGIGMYGKCGRIGDGELGWIRELSNDKFVCGKKLNLSGSWSLFS